jgi:hypothetical protein
MDHIHVITIIMNEMPTSLSFMALSYDIGRPTAEFVIVRPPDNGYTAHGPGVDLASNRNEYLEPSRE